jgi:hypothetical protein
MRSAPFPWAIVPALLILWFAPVINRWIDRTSHPRPDRPRPPVVHETPVQVRIVRPNPNRELERRD